MASHHSSSSTLSSDYYEKSCPDRSPFYHRVCGAKRLVWGLPCFVSIFTIALLMQGCDGSILLDDTPNLRGEKTAGPNNNSLRGYQVIDTIKSQVESLCPNVVSCAYILAIAARDSVVALGGPTWNVLLGRRDSTTASLTAANNNIPAPFLNLSDLVSAFSNKGFSVQELVALSGSHTIGQAQCRNFREHIYNETNIDSSFSRSRRVKCPRSGGDENLSSLDKTSPKSFDNAYFKNLKLQKGLLHSDQQLFINGGYADSYVETYSSNSATFFKDFANAILAIGVRSGPIAGIPTKPHHLLTYICTLLCLYSIAFELMFFRHVICMNNLDTLKN